MLNLQEIEKQLGELDASVQALGAIGELLCMCPPNHRVNANALGHLLYVVQRDLANGATALDKQWCQRVLSHSQSRTHSHDQANHQG